MTERINEHILALAPKMPNWPRSADAIRLDLGEMPYPPSPRVVQAVGEAASMMNRYPDVAAATVREALAAYAEVSADQIVIGNGSDDLIELIVKVFLSTGEEVLLPIPTFFMYGHATQLVGAVPVLVPRRPDFGLDVPALLRRATPRSRLTFIANPNNPTANLTSRDELVQLLEGLDGLKCIVVVDECYYELSGQTVADLVGRHDNLIVLRSFSKSFGLAGLRVGYVITNRTFGDYMVRASQPFAVNRIAQAAVLAALRDLDYFRKHNADVLREKETLRSGLEALGFTVYPSVTNFLFIGTKALGVPSERIVVALRARNIYVADFGLKPGLDAYYFRTAVGTPVENRVLLSALPDVLAECAR